MEITPFLREPIASCAIDGTTAGMLRTDAMRLRCPRLLFPISTIAAIFSTGCTESPRDVDPLPSTADIQSMTADYQARTGPIKFEVPPEHWRTIFAALQPARTDPDPAKWVMLGDIHITLKDGRPFLVSLYAISEGAGAFSAGETWEKRTYFRGGTTSKLEGALRAAYESSEN